MGLGPLQTEGADQDTRPSMRTPSTLAIAGHLAAVGNAVEILAPRAKLGGL